MSASGVAKLLRDAQGSKLETAREGARSLARELAKDDPDKGIVEGAILDVLCAMAEREGLEDAIDIIEDEPACSTCNGTKRVTQRPPYAREAREVSCPDCAS